MSSNTALWTFLAAGTIIALMLAGGFRAQSLVATLVAAVLSAYFYLAGRWIFGNLPSISVVPVAILTAYYCYPIPRGIRATDLWIRRCTLAVLIWAVLFGGMKCLNAVN